MSTNAYIAIQNSVEDFTFIRLNWDGYPSHAMKTLLKNYNSEEQARELIALGDLSGLGGLIESCNAYHRDRKEEWDDVQPFKAQMLESVLHMASNDFLYIWMDGKWNAYKEGEEIFATNWADHD